MESFSFEEDLKLHQYVHEETSDFTCPICKEKLSGELLVKQSASTFKCYCLSERYLLKRHLIRHMIQKPYICIACNKSFSNSKDLKNHFLEIHEGLQREKKQFCKFCDRR